MLTLQIKKINALCYIFTTHEVVLISGLGGGLMCHMFTTVNYTQYTLLPLIHVENGKQL